MNVARCCQAIMADDVLRRVREPTIDRRFAIACDFTHSYIREVRARDALSSDRTSSASKVGRYGEFFPRQVRSGMVCIQHVG